jgi:hypothetical protein
MIFIFSVGLMRKVKSNIQTSSDLKRVLQLDHMSDPEGFDQRVLNGLDVYCYISPYASEKHHRKELYWCATENEATRAYHESENEI